MNWLFASGGQSIGVSASVLPVNIQVISLKTDWSDLLAVQGSLKSLLRYYNSRASILWHSAFFIQLSHPYMTTGKTIALTIQTFVGKVMALLFNMLSRFVMVFLPKSKRLSIPWLQLPSAVILEPKKIKSVTVSTFSLCFCQEVMEPNAIILVLLMLSIKPAIYSLLLLSTRDSSVWLHFLPLEWYLYS